MRFRFAARLAGMYPKSSPIPTDTLKETRIATGVGEALMPMRVPATPVAPQPIRIPMMPPKELVTAA